MKTSLAIKLLLLLAVAPLLTACIVQSTNPYYTKSHLVKSPASIQGKWFKYKMAKPWVINGTKITSYGKGNVKGIINVRFFKVNGVLYCDSSPGDIDNAKNNSYWAFHVSPMHLLSQVIISNSEIKFSPLDPDTLKKLIKEHSLSLPSTNPASRDNNIYYANPEQWIKFLTQYGSTPGLFTTKEAIVLKRKLP